MHDTAHTSRAIIPYEATCVAAQARTEKGEFEMSSITTFPVIKFSQPFFGVGGARNEPSNWDVFVRVFSNELSSLIQLYIVVANRPEQGLVGYDVAVLPGGRRIRLNHITSNVDRSGTDGQWVENLAIDLNSELLTSHLHTPLRLKVENGREGISFVVEIPSHYVAAVLYAMRPNDFEVADAPQVATREARTATLSSEQAAVLVNLKKSAWIGVAVALPSMLVWDFSTGAAIGVCTLLAASYAFDFLERKRGKPHVDVSPPPGELAVPRHPLRSPADNDSSF